MKEGLEPPDPERVRAAQSAFLRFLADRIAGDLLREEAGEPQRPDPQPPGDGRCRRPDPHR